MQQKDNSERGGNPYQNKNPLLNQSYWKNQSGVDAVKVAVAEGNDPSEMNAISMAPVVIAINSGAPNESIIFLLKQEGNEVSKLIHDGRTYFTASGLGIAIMKPSNFHIFS